MGIETKGRLHTIFDTKQMSERFTKREFVIRLRTTPSTHSSCCFRSRATAAHSSTACASAMTVRVEFSLRGREWHSPSGEVKYFNSLDVWSVDAVGGRYARPASPAPKPTGGATLDDDIPFATCLNVGLGEIAAVLK